MKHSTALQLSILVALGIVPVACGGTTSNGPDQGTGGSSGNGTGGSSGSGTGGSSGNGTGGTHPSGGGSTNQAGSSPTVNQNNHFPCTSPQVDPKSGIVACAEGYSHRPQSVVCGAVTAHKLPTPGPDASGALQPRADGTVPCADEPTICAQFLYGYCASPPPPGGELRCESGCASDYDCGKGEICSCSTDPNAAVPGTCLPAHCHTDQDCATGFCASSESACGSGGFACQTADDECQTNADCDGGGYCGLDGQFDTLPPIYFRVCGDAVCGRPFLVEAEARVAPVVASAAWTTPSALSPQLDQLTTTERAALAEHWTHLGQMEHASIAAFARFSLQLLALGAPPELVDACTRALGDETTHTKLCFALASAYAGRAVGPGPLDIAHSLDVTSLVDTVELVIAEGCFGETSAALDALTAADTATDPVIAGVYRQIARDEQRHAELAFRFVRWALEQGGNAVETRVQAAIEAPPSPSAQAVAVPCLIALLQSRRSYECYGST
jgi:hypothetical protein